jgi:hypothetical protein
MHETQCQMLWQPSTAAYRLTLSPKSPALRNVGSCIVAYPANQQIINTEWLHHKEHCKHDVCLQPDTTQHRSIHPYCNTNSGNRTAQPANARARMNCEQALHCKSQNVHQLAGKKPAILPLHLSLGYKMLEDSVSYNNGSSHKPPIIFTLKHIRRTLPLQHSPADEVRGHTRFVSSLLLKSTVRTEGYQGQP